MKLSRRGMIVVAGSLWGLVGGILGCVGISLIVRQHGAAACLLGCGAIAIGLFKGRLVMGSLAERNVVRIKELPAGGRIWHIYPPGVWLFILCMAILGATLRRLANVAPGQWGTGTLGVVDLAVGTALLVGALRYRRLLATVTPGP